MAGSLDLTRGGPDIDCHAGRRHAARSVYFRHAYEKQMKFLELFDAANVNECYRRSESIMPQQALALANSTLSIDQSRLLAQRLSEMAATREVRPDRAFVATGIRADPRRDPSAAELSECLSIS